MNPTTDSKKKSAVKSQLTKKAILILIAVILLWALSLFLTYRHFNNLFKISSELTKAEIENIGKHLIDQQALINEKQESIEDLKQELDDQIGLMAAQQKLAKSRAVDLIEKQEQAERMAGEALKVNEIITNERDIAIAKKLHITQQLTESESLLTESKRINLRELARSLALRAISIGQAGDKELAALLALQAHRINLENGGEPDDPEIFRALARTAGKPTTLYGFTDAIRRIEWHEDSGDLFTASDDGSLIRWCTKSLGKNYSSCANIDINHALIRSLAVESAGEMVLAGTADGKIIQWNYNDTIILPLMIKGHKGIVSAVAFSVDEQSFFSAGHDGQVSHWSVDGELIRHLQLPTSGARVNDICLHPEGNVLAWADNHGVIRFATTRGEAIHRLNMQGAITTINFSPDGSLFSCGSVDGEIMMFSFPSFNPLIRKKVHKAGINQLKFHNSKQMLASCSYDGTVQLHLLNHKLTTSLLIDEQESWVYTIAFSPDGKSIAAAGADRNVRLLSIEPDALVRKICQYAKRTLTRDEWNALVGNNLPYDPVCNDKTKEKTPDK
ncbi:MAG: hypothetical protein U1C46_10515 [Bacteroidales bacterium]|nr:hypothetical protein [Bacteroidales bacterium]MDZ4205232.1 hypothetical protein [Bacteroidales bacterium]